jgi:hypothetical protein
MISCNPTSLAFAMLIAALPVGFGFAGGSGGRGSAIGAGVGADPDVQNSRIRFFTGALRSWWCSDGQSEPLAMDIGSVDR